MKIKAKILGFYRRKRDESEYVLFEENGKLFLTNGIFVWDNHAKRIEERYMLELEKVEEIDLSKITKALKIHKPFSMILEELDDLVEEKL